MYLDPRNPSLYNGLPSEAYRDGWPEPELVAKPDSIGAAIIAYADRFRDHPDFPASPWSDRHGAIHLPDLDQPQNEFDETPRYKMLRDAVVNGNLYLEGAEVASPYWPPIATLAYWQPMNESARRVCRYRERYHNIAKLPGVPFNSARRQLHLPRDPLPPPAAENPPASLRIVA